jgi:hypothetical protein
MRGRDPYDKDFYPAPGGLPGAGSAFDGLSHRVGARRAYRRALRAHADARISADTPPSVAKKL